MLSGRGEARGQGGGMRPPEAEFLRGRVYVEPAPRPLLHPVVSALQLFVFVFLVDVLLAFLCIRAISPLWDQGEKDTRGIKKGGGGLVRECK